MDSNNMEIINGKRLKTSELEFALEMHKAYIVSNLD